MLKEIKEALIYKKPLNKKRKNLKKCQIIMMFDY